MTLNNCDIPPAVMKRGPINEVSGVTLERVVKTDVAENEYRKPQTVHPMIGNVNHAGTLDSLDF